MLALQVIRCALQADLSVASRGVGATGLDARVADARDDREQRACRQGRDDRYAWPSDNRVIEVAVVPRSGPRPRNT